MFGRAQLLPYVVVAVMIIFAEMLWDTLWHNQVHPLCFVLVGKMSLETRQDDSGVVEKGKGLPWTEEAHPTARGGLPGIGHVR